MPSSTLSRRRFLLRLSLATIGSQAGCLSSQAAEQPADDSLRSIEPLGMLVPDCTLPGERRQDGVVPCHGSGIQVSRERWLFIYSTHDFRGVDDERSIVYQLRDGAPDGKVLKEGFLAQGVEDFDALGDGVTSPGPGKTYFKQPGHPVLFGVPQGAIHQGQSLAHAGLFVAKWRQVARVLDKERNFLEHSNAHLPTRMASQSVQWLQFRLNAKEDDIEIVQPAKMLRQQGYETGPMYCRHENIARMNQAFVRPVAANADSSEWADCNHFGGQIAALKYRFNPQTKLYEWTEIGPLIAHQTYRLSEASLCRLGEAWIIAARVGGHRGPAWLTTPDPFGKLPPLVFADTPASNSPISAYTCADGMLRLFTGDSTLSPAKNGRDPLYCWDIDRAVNFTATNRRTVYDSVAAKLPFRPSVVPKLDFSEVLPQHGGTQLVCHRVNVRAYNFPYAGSDGTLAGIPAINDEEKAACGIYYERLHFRDPPTAAWEFAGLR